jgi:Rv2525c-like, glycoside hydrolase-like domain
MHRAAGDSEGGAVIVADFAWSKPSAAQLRSWGAVAVGMYVSSDPAKNATRALVDEYAQAGIRTFLFFENTASGATGGYSQGKADAELAGAQAEALGKPAWAPVLAAADFDVPDYAPSSNDPRAKLGPLAGYWQAWNDVLGRRQAGGYGGYWVISRLAAAGLISAGVQTVAWSGGQVDVKDIAALQNARTLDNGNVDVEVIESANLLARLAWVPGEADPLAPQPAPPARPATVPSDMHLVTVSLPELARGASDSHLPH